MTQHTPGPWECGYLRITLPDNTVIAHAVAYGGISKDQATANARLIAASPDLLMALLNAIECHGTDYGWGPQAVDAIRKAKGLDPLDDTNPYDIDWDGTNP